MAQRQYDIKDLRMMLSDYSETDTVRIADVEVPARFEVRLIHPEWSVDAVLSVAVDPEAGPVALGIRAKEPPETYRDAAAQLGRTVELDTVLAHAAALAAGVLAAERIRALAGTASVPQELMDQLVEFKNVVEVQAREAMRPQRRRRVTRTLLRQVAEVYRKALAEGEAPTVAVRSHFQVSHSTAARWVGQARKLGELGPAVGPTGGEKEADG